MKILILFLALAATPSLAQTASSDGALMAENCQICHGLQGVGAGDVPAITGHTPEELTAILTGFRSGETPSTIMERLIKPLTDADIAALAAEIATWK